MKIAGSAQKTGSVAFRIRIRSELLLVTRSNDNHSPGPVMREVSP